VTVSISSGNAKVDKHGAYIDVGRGLRVKPPRNPCLSPTDQVAEDFEDDEVADTFWMYQMW